MRLLNVLAASAMAASLMGGYAMADSGQATPALWNGQENSLGANSAGGGNRYAHTAPVPAATAGSQQYVEWRRKLGRCQ